MATMNAEQKAQPKAAARREAHARYQEVLETTLREYELPMQIAQVVKTINQNWKDKGREPWFAYDYESGGVGGYTYEMIQHNIRLLDNLLTRHELNLEYYLEDGKPKGVRIAEICE